MDRLPNLYFNPTGRINRSMWWLNTIILSLAVATGLLSIAILVACTQPGQTVEVPVTVEAEATREIQVPVTVEVEREVIVTLEVPVTVEIETVREVPVPVTVEVEATREVPVTVEVEATREVEVTRQVEVAVTREVYITREVPVTVEVEATREVVREIPATVQVEVTREIPVTVTREIPVTVQVEITREVPIDVSVKDLDDEFDKIDTDNDNFVSIHQVCDFYEGKELPAATLYWIMSVRHYFARFGDDKQREWYGRTTRFQTNREYCDDYYDWRDRNPQA